MPRTDSPDPVVRRVVIDEEVRTRREFYRALADRVYPPSRPAPPNLDALTDLLREYHVTEVVCPRWELGDRDTSRVAEVFTDLGVGLRCRPTRR